MARTKQTARASTGGKVQRPPPDLYAQARKNHLSTLYEQTFRSKVLLDDVTIVASKDERVYYKDASPKELEALASHLRTTRDNLQQALEKLTKIGEFQETVVAKPEKRSHFPGKEETEDNDRPTKRARLD